jgi:hypothetical protein
MAAAFTCKARSTRMRAQKTRRSRSCRCPKASACHFHQRITIPRRTGAPRRSPSTTYLSGYVRATPATPPTAREATMCDPSIADSILTVIESGLPLAVRCGYCPRRVLRIRTGLSIRPITQGPGRRDIRCRLEQNQDPFRQTSSSKLEGRSTTCAIRPGKVKPRNT